MKKIKWIMIVIAVIAYMCTFGYRYQNTKRLKVQYVEQKSEIEYCGFEYKLNAKYYSHDEFAKEFNVDTKWLEAFSMGDEFKFIVVERHITKLNDDANLDANFFYYQSLNSKYWNCKPSEELTYKIQKEGYKEIEKLKTGESTSGYLVYAENKKSLCDSVWNDLENTTVFYDFEGYRAKGYEGNYEMKRVRVLN